MEYTMTATPVTPDPKCLVSGPCWNLYLKCKLFESLSFAVAMLFHVNSSGLTVYFGLLRKYSVSSMRCGECQDKWYVFEKNTE